MDTARLKRFATEARTKIKQGVTLMIRQWGFDADGNVMEEPQLLQGGTLFRNQVIGDEDVYHRWCALKIRYSRQVFVMYMKKLPTHGLTDSLQ